MKKIWLFATLLAAFILSACGTVSTDGTPRPEEGETYVAIFEEAYFDDHQGTLESLSTTPRPGTVERAEVGDRLVFVGSHRRGPLYVHVRVFDPDGYVVAEEGPFEDWDGLSANRYDLRYTVTKVGRYHLQMITTGYNGQPFGGSPYNAYVDVTERGGSTPPPPSGSCTSTTRASLDTPSSVNRNERFDARFYVPCGSDYVSLQLYDSDGYEIDRWTFSSSDLNRYEGSSVRHTISHSSNDRLHVQLNVDGRYPARINTYVRVGSGGGGTPPPSDSCRSTTRASLDVPSSVNRNESFNARFYVPCGSDYVSLQVYDSDGYEIDRWTFSSSDLDRYEGREVSYRLSHNREETLLVQLTVNGKYPSQINRDVRVGSSGGGTPPPPGTANCPTSLDVRVRYGDFNYEDVVYIPRSGENFRLIWSSASRDFADGNYVQLYDASRGVDVFQSNNRTGDRTINPSTLQAGEYHLRFTGYHGDGRTACLRIVTIHIM